MKKFKKLIAVVAMMAICCSMRAPVSASAALNVCTHATIGLHFKEEVVMRTDTHLYYFLMDVVDDGEDNLELVLDECERKTIKLIYERRCDCGLKYIEEISVYVYEHSKDCGTVEE